MNGFLALVLFVSLVQLATVVLILRLRRPSRLRDHHSDLRRQHKVALRTIGEALRIVDDALVVTDPASRLPLTRLEMCLAPWRTRVHRVIPRESSRANR